MCVWINKVHLLHFSFFSLKSYLFSRPRLRLFALHWLKANVRIPKQFRHVAVNEEDYCLSVKTRTALEVFPWTIHHTFELLVQWRHPFILHPRGEPKSATKGCRASWALEKLGTKSIAHWSGTIVDHELQFLTLLLWNTANVLPCLLSVLDWYLLRFKGEDGCYVLTLSLSSSDPISFCYFVHVHCTMKKMFIKKIKK